MKGGIMFIKIGCCIVVIFVIGIFAKLVKLGMSAIQSMPAHW